MADPRWWWDSGAQFEIQHPFPFYSHVWCQLQFFHLVDDANITKREKPSGKQVLWYSENDMLVNLSNQVQTVTHILHHSIPFRFSAIILPLYKWWGEETRNLKRQTQQTHYVDKCQWVNLSLTTEPRMGCALPWALTAWPLDLFWKITFYFGQW